MITIQGVIKTEKKDKKVKKIDFLFKLKIKRAKMQVKKYQVNKSMCIFRSRAGW